MQLNNDFLKVPNPSASSTNGASHVVTLIPRGEVIRNLVYSGVLDHLAENSRLSLLTVNPNSELTKALRHKCENAYPLVDFRERWLVRIQREMIDISHNRWLWSKAAQERWRLRDVEAVTSRQRSKRNIKKILSYPFANKTGLKVLGKIERTTSRWLKTTENYEKLFKELRPTLVFNGSHVHSSVATQAVQAAQWLGIPTATFIFSWDNLTSQGRIMLPYDYFLVWNDELKAQLLDMYDWISPDSVFVTGTPQFDFHFRDEFYLSREEFCQSIGADPERPIILYTTGMANHMPGEPELVEGIADILNSSNTGKKPQLLVRVYAKDLTGRFDDLMKRRPDILFPKVEWEPSWLTPKYEDSYALVNGLRHCSIGINVASTVSLELCMFDKPVINVGYNPKSVGLEVLSYANYYNFDHYKPLVESGAVQVAWSENEMRTLIEENLKSADGRANQRKKLIDQMFGATLDGGSAQRVAKILLRLAAV